MLKKISINLCDYAGTYAPMEVMIGQYKRLITNINELCPDAVVDEVWIGSEFCENLFLIHSVKEYQARIDYYADIGKKVYIAVPELHETHFHHIFSLLNQLQKINGFVSNDIGTSLTIRKQFPDKRLILGRAFDKTVREIRLSPPQICDKYNNEKADIHKGILDDVHLSFLNSLGANAIITDSIPYFRAEVDASKMEVYYEYPRTMLSQAAICEFSEVEGNNPLHGCKYGCFKYAKSYTLSEKKLTKKGKIIYYREEREIDQCISCTSGDIHLVYTI